MDQNKVYGIDLGTKKCVVSEANLFTTDVLLNESSNRENPVAIAFKDNFRLIGEQASLHYRTNLLNTAKGFTAFIGKQKNFSFTHQGTILQLNSIQLTGAYLKHICGKIHGEVSITYPDYYTEVELQDLYLATIVAEINVKYLIPECQALTNYYHLKKEIKDGQSVLFLDFGHSKFSGFLLQNNEVKYKVYDRNLGTSSMDALLCDWIVKQINYNQQEKVALKVLDACETMRKTLSANNECYIEIENINNGEDFFRLLKREEYEEITRPVLSQIQSYCLFLIKKTRSSSQRIDCIELVGGGSRIKSFVDMIQSTFIGIPIQKTLHATEAISEGCALTAVIKNMNNDTFKSNKFESIYVGLHEQLLDTLSDGMIHTNNFFQLLKYEEGLKVSLENPCYITLFYNPPIKEIRQLIKQYVVHSPRDIRFRNDSMGLIALDNCDLVFTHNYDIKQFVQLERKLCQDDERILQEQSDRNNLERTIYKIENECKTRNLSIRQLEKIGQEIDEIKNCLSQYDSKLIANDKVDFEALRVGLETLSLEIFSL